MILIYLGIIFFIYINLKNKVNLLGNKINYIDSKFNEKNLNYLNNIKYKNISRVELSEISFEKFDENILQKIKRQQIEFCNNQNKYF